MDKEKIIKKTNIEKTHVPDKVYAFMIQSHHMLYELLNCKDGDNVSVEVFDDVGVEHEDGSKEAIQLKSALSNRNPVSNKATDLWKTMYNWLISVEVGVFEPENVKFILFLNVNKQGSIKTVDFWCEKVNVITGASRTGKSAIIPIIDYCLGDGNCQIPVNTIRDACSWFGVIVKLENKRILLARREPGQQKSTDDMMLLEGQEIVIPKIPDKNTTRKNVRRYLDEIARVSFLEIEQDEMNGFTDRPSFRDMMAFCYQSQNIVANALFYKAVQILLC